MTQNKQNLENELEIDLTKNYSGEEVASLIDIILEEADVIIQESYAEGYKQATLELLPQIESYKISNNSLKKDKVKNFFITTLSSLACGFILGFSIK